MVYRKKKLPYRRKAKKSVRRKRNYKVSITRQVGTAISDVQIVRMVYHTTVSINPAAGAAGNYLMHANSIYDPDPAVGGHQPYGHDEWSAFYAHYCVIGSKITATFASPSSAALAGQCLVGVGLQRTSTLLTNADTIIERKQARYRYLGTTYSGRDGTVVTHGYSPKRLFGYKDLGDSAETRTSFGSNPTDLAYFNVFVSPFGSADVGDVAVSVKIDYVVRLSERNDLPGS